MVKILLHLAVLAELWNTTVIRKGKKIIVIVFPPCTTS